MNQRFNNDFEISNSSDLNDLAQNSSLFHITKDAKKWRSMHALRDSLRNLTSCVSTRSNINEK